MMKEILEKISIYQRNGSGWYFKEVSSLEIHIIDYKPIKGGSYVPLPDFIIKKKSIINIQNKGNKKPYGFIDGPFIPQDTQSKKSEYIESA